MDIRDIVSNKNRFMATCKLFKLPLLKTFCLQAGDGFDEIGTQIDPDKAYIIKPATDRTRFEDQRRRFYVLQNVGALRVFMASKIGQEMIREEYQVQEYIDFHTTDVAYYNATYFVGDTILSRLVTKQILNMSAIHNNGEALHWGNASIANLAFLQPGIAGCALLVEHYQKLGYRGEIGIDFGVANGEFFFLEANARENNGTRLHRQLQELGIDHQLYEFIYLRNIPFEFMQKEKRHCDGVSVIESVIDCGDRKLVASLDKKEIALLLALLDQMIKQEPPFPY